jgi:hypothetical protein
MANSSAYINGILTRLQDILVGDRNNEHGDARECLNLIGQYWGLYLDRPITENDVVILMSLLKIARSAVGNEDNPDHLLDMAGYSILGLAIKEEDNS